MNSFPNKIDEVLLKLVETNVTAIGANARATRPSLGFGSFACAQGGGPHALVLPRRAALYNADTLSAHTECPQFSYMQLPK
jgi:hypothetical protein